MNDWELELEQKQEWPNHLAELTHAYNLTWLAVTAFSPHYLCLATGHILPIDYYFPVDQVMGRTKLVNAYMLKLVTTLRSTLKATREVTQEEVACQKRLYDRKVSVVTLEVGVIVLVRTDVFQGKRKIKD